MCSLLFDFSDERIYTLVTLVLIYANIKLQFPVNSCSVAQILTNEISDKSTRCLSFQRSNELKGSNEEARFSICYRTRSRKMSLLSFAE